MHKRAFLLSAVALACAGILGTAATTTSAAELKTIRVGVVGDYNAHWETVNKLLEKEGLQVKLVKYSDYATPNRTLADKEIDLNAFQHKAFLKNDMERNGYDLVSIADTLITPLCVYNNKSKIKSMSDIKKGDIIAIPSDLTNGGRALKVLEAAGLIELDPAKGFVANKTDIVKYNVKIKIREAESGILARILPDVTAALINGGNAFTAGLDPTKDSIYSENIDPAVNPAVESLVNIIAARRADADNPDYQKVVKAFQTPEVAKTLLEAYKGAFKPAWKEAQTYDFMK